MKKWLFDPFPLAFGKKISMRLPCGGGGGGQRNFTSLPNHETMRYLVVTMRLLMISWLGSDLKYFAPPPPRGYLVVSWWDHELSHGHHEVPHGLTSENISHGYRIFCQAQPKLQIKLTLKAELALFSFDPATTTPTPTHIAQPPPVKVYISC